MKTTKIASKRKNIPAKFRITVLFDFQSYCNMWFPILNIMAKVVSSQEGLEKNGVKEMSETLAKVILKHWEYEYVIMPVTWIFNLMIFCTFLLCR